MSDVRFTFGRCSQCAEAYRLPADAVGKRARCRACGAVFRVEQGDAGNLDQPSTVGETLDHAEVETVSFPGIGDTENIEAVGQHIERHLGPVHKVLHEMLSDVVHIDVHWVQPTRERPWHHLVTSGMSDLPMNTPEGAEECRFAELMITLPPDWRLSMEDLKNLEWYWPIRCLKSLARYPHQYKTWVWRGHSVASSDEMTPFAPNTKLCAVVLLPTLSAPDGFQEMVAGDKHVSFFSVVPLYREELEHKIKYGVDKLLARFDKHGIGDLIDPKRKNVCERKWGLFG